MGNAIILFSVKDKDYFGMSNQYVADAFMAFKDIADITSDSGTIKQLHLPLTRPQNEGKCLNFNKKNQNLMNDYSQNLSSPSKLFNIESATNWRRNS